MWCIMGISYTMYLFVVLFSLPHHAFRFIPKKLLSVPILRGNIFKTLSHNSGTTLKLKKQYESRLLHGGNKPCPMSWSWVKGLKWQQGSDALPFIWRPVGRAFGQNRVKERKMKKERRNSDLGSYMYLEKLWHLYVPGNVWTMSDKGYFKHSKGQ